jgi:hypothetical protein
VTIHTGSVVRLLSVPTIPHSLQIGDVGVVMAPPEFACATVQFFRTGRLAAVKMFRLEEVK